MKNKPKTEIWVCLDKDGYPVFTAGWKEACHEHINDAVLHDKSAGKWVVRQVMELPAKTESVLIENVAYTLPIEVACELLRLHIDLKTSQAEVDTLRKDATDWKALHVAVTSGQSYWPNNWSQDIAMVAYALHLKDKDAEWIPVSERLPEIPTNCTREFIVACQRKHDGKTYVFAAEYLQELLLHSSSPDDDEPEDGKPYTGWYQERNCESGDFDTEWQNIEADGDLITHWKPLPESPKGDL